MPYFALTRPFREFYLANELRNKPRGVVLVFHLLIKRLLRSLQRAHFSMKRFHALRRATTHAATATASCRAPLVFRRLDNNPSILAYRDRAQGLEDSAYGFDRRSTLAADRGRFEIQSWKPQSDRGPVPPCGVPRH